MSESTHPVALGGENQNSSLYANKLLCGIELLKTEDGLEVVYIWLTIYLNASVVFLVY